MWTAVLPAQPSRNHQKQSLKLGKRREKELAGEKAIQR